MPLQLLLLVTLLGLGSSVWSPVVWEDGAKETLSLLLARGRRQVPLTEDPDFDEDVDYVQEGTDPPEMLEESSLAETLSPKPLTLVGTSEQSGPAGPGTSDATSVELITRDPAGLSTGLADQGSPDTQTPAILPTSDTPPMGPVIRATLSTLPSGLETTEALPTTPAATGAPTTMVLVTTESATSEPATTEPATTETLPTLPVAREASSTESTASGSMEPVATTATQSANTRAPVTTSLPVAAAPQSKTTMAARQSFAVSIRQWENKQGLSPRSSATPSPTGIPDSIPVKQCLLAILILALVATIFLVCTVVLAVRLSRKNHMYPIRSYSPTEMVCISSLLPEGGEGPNTSAANGGPPNAKSQGQKPEEPRESHDGDDLTLRSFLP
ncbi:PREDICTED: P-selectin glycoprotein ligand 1 [Chrysochloris asiatica]|uniref:P-selectin glycoprotein ligand 1 n=1 Tax=Chrysochloris asiatica TaxID=185453 RepID=A0A9B0TTH7_CHRAS|nr:PREDICTED: P-selectin glycoprotein ligand 1 [Chrysochloris asiatica]